MPFDGSLSLEPERARLEVKEARMCGVSFPMEVEAVPEKITAAAHISMHERAAGEIDPLPDRRRRRDHRQRRRARRAARPRGGGRDLFRNLTGTVEAEVRKGRVKRFALIGNILSLRNIASATEMKEDGFPYRSMTAKGHFRTASSCSRRASSTATAVRLAATWQVDLLGDNSQLTVLVGLADQRRPRGGRDSDSRRRASAAR